MFSSKLQPDSEQPRDWADEQRVECVLASARAFLAVCVGAVVYLDSLTSAQRAGGSALILIALYGIHSLVILGLARAGVLSPRVRMFVRGTDVAWPATLGLVLARPGNRFDLLDLLFLFALISAADRGGFRDTIATTLAVIAAVTLQEVVALSSDGQRLSLAWLAPFVTRGAYLFTAGMLLGYLAKRQRQGRAESSSIEAIRVRLRVDDGATGTIGAVAHECARWFDPARILIAVRATSTGQATLWEARRMDAVDGMAVTSVEVDETEAESYFFPAPTHTWWAVRRPDARDAGPLRLAVGFDSAGRHAPRSTWTVTDRLAEARTCESMLCVSFDVDTEWTGRLFLLDPKIRGETSGRIHFAQRLALEIAPEVHKIALIGRLRSRAAALERARIARELHDGVIQSLIGAEMRVHVLRGKLQNQSENLAKELSQVQNILRREALNVRELIERIKPVEIDPGDLVSQLQTMITRFEQETGISGTFECQGSTSTLSARICGEVVRIVQEAIANVRRHSGARYFGVELADWGAEWTLLVADNGQGFDSTGGAPHVRRVPEVIAERARSIGGRLAVDSAPGQGTRLVIAFPSSRSTSRAPEAADTTPTRPVARLAFWRRPVMAKAKLPRHESTHDDLVRGHNAVARRARLRTERF